MQASSRRSAGPRRSVASAPAAPPETGAPEAGAVDDLLDAAITASRALVGLAARSLASCAEDVTLPQYRMLVVLAARGACPANELAAELGVAAPTATRMCDRLVRKRLVVRRRNARDRRQVVLALSPAGQDLVATVTDARREALSEQLQRLPADRRAVLVEAFQSFADAAGEPADADWAAGWNL